MSTKAYEGRAPKEVLVTDITMEGLRRFCSRHDIERPNALNKTETVNLIMEEAGSEARDWLRAMGYTLN